MNITQKLISALLSGVIAFIPSAAPLYSADAAVLSDISSEIYDSTKADESKDYTNEPFDVFGIYEAYQARHEKATFPAETTVTTARQTTAVPVTTAKPVTSAVTTAASTSVTGASVTTTTNTDTAPDGIPIRLETVGIDVAKFQKEIDWKKVKNSGIDFAIVQAGYGKHANQKDPYFDRNVQNAQAAGVDVGAYWYSYAANTDDALQEAELFYSIIKDYKFTYPVYLDIEEQFQARLPVADVSAMVETFCGYLRDKGLRVGVYSYASFLQANVYRSVLDKYDIWVAQYNTTQNIYTGEYGVWQFTGTGRVDGVPTDVDINYSYINYPYLISPDTYKGPMTAPPTTTTISKATTAGTTTTTAAPYKGIDISSVNGDVDWNAVKKAGMDFVILRAGKGGDTITIDPKFAENAKNAAAAGLGVGAYWYACSTTPEGMAKEAEAFYNTIKDTKLSYPIYLNIEDPAYLQSGLTVTQMTALVKSFCGYFEGKKCYVGLYSFEYLLNNCLDPSLFTLYDVWVANYGVAKPTFKSKYGMWQYTNDSKVDGIANAVSMNHCYKNYPSIMEYNHLNGF